MTNSINQTSQQPEILIIIGVAGAGKSTFKRTWLRAHPRYAAVSRDDYRVMFFGRDKNNLLNQNQEALVTDVQMQSIRLLLEKGYSVLVDNTHVDWSYIKPLYSLTKRVRFHLVDTSLDEALRRNAARPPSDVIPADAIRRMHEKLTRLRESRHWAEEIQPALLTEQDFR